MKKLFLVLWVSTLAFANAGKWAVLQGPTSDSETVFAVLHKKDEVIQTCIGQSVEKCDLRPSKISVKGHSGSDWVVTQLDFGKVPPGIKMVFKVEDSKGASDLRSFGMLQKKGTLKFAVASCVDDRFKADQEAMWKGLLSKSPDVIFLIGDNTYADSQVLPGQVATPDMLWRRYSETRELVTLFRSERLVPIYATWDDHDYGANDGGADYTYKVESAGVFFSFFPQRNNKTLKLGSTVNSVLSLAGQDFIFLDDRTHRTKDTHWGAEQEEWLFSLLNRSGQPVWLINGGQFFGGYHKFESYEGNQPSSFKAFLARLSSVKRTVNFVSGDRHIAEVMKIGAKEFGHEAYELTSSGIHGKMRPDAWKDTPNPRQVRGVAGEFNYMVVESTASKEKLSVKLHSYGKDKTLFEFSFEQKN